MLEEDSQKVYRRQQEALPLTIGAIPRSDSNMQKMLLGSAGACALLSLLAMAPTPSGKGHLHGTLPYLHYLLFCPTPTLQQHATLFSAGASFKAALWYPQVGQSINQIDFKYMNIYQE